MSEQPNLGNCLRNLRKRQRWTLQHVSDRTGVAISTLSKVENEQLSLSYDKILQICEGLSIHVTELLGSDQPASVKRTRRSISSPANTLRQLTANYDYHYLATDIARKRMVPILAQARARNLAEFGPLIQHSGEEYLYVIKGEIEVHTDEYSPVRLKAGDSIYIDSMMGHAFLSTSHEDAEILCVCSSDEHDLQSTLFKIAGENQ